jgi:hypothetical protein
MAQEEQNTSSGQVRSFDKGLNEDVNDFHLPSNEWTQARNAINNSVTGDLGKLGNEPANLKCVELDYTIIGTIHVIEDKWLLYSTDKLGNCEIGLFREETCIYVPLVNDPCLEFSLDKLIIGVCRPTSTCTYIAYWDDGLNPSRRLEFNADFIDTVPIINPNLPTDPNSTIPWVQTCNIVNGCNICTNTPVLDCDKLRLALFMDPICPRVERGVSGGNLLNGSYLVAMAYAINGQKISDWYVSNAQGLFDHNNSASSLDVFIDSIDSRYDEIIVATIAIINQQTAVRQAGLYSTRQTKLSFDTIFDTWPAIPIEQIPIMTPIVDKSDAMYNVGDYLIRVGPTSKFDFNYQPLANQIVTKWQSVEYPVDYYKKGGNQVGYMRDEVYAFFIQWIYDTGDKSASYHIPGRPALVYTPLAPLVDNSPFSGTNSLPGDTKVFETFNTATWINSYPPGTIPTQDGGSVIAEGFMGYWESTEIYPDNKPEIWNASDPSHPWSAITSAPPYSTTNISDYDLCGDPIRHHKFPEDVIATDVNGDAKMFNSGFGNKIRVMGVKFENVKAPRDNDGFLIPGIVGYRILRSTRNGNKSIIAKGIINNMGSYNIPGSNKTGLYPNYPYNDLQDDPFLSASKTKTNGIGVIVNDTPLLGGANYKNNYLTFHSPDTNFNNPFLATKELKIYGNVWGGVDGKYDLVEKHPKEKLITNLTFIIAGIAGLGIAAIAANGKKRTTYTGPKSSGVSGLFAAGNGTQPDLAQGGIYNTAMVTAIAAIISADIAANSAGTDTGQAILGAPSSLRYLASALSSTGVAAGIINGTGVDYKVEQEDGYLSGLNTALSVASGVPLFLNYFTEGTDSIIRLVKAIIRYRDFAVRYHSHGFYNNFNGPPPDFRFNVEKQIYLNPEIAEFEPGFQINNLFRNRTVALKTITSPSLPGIPNPNVIDHTRYDSTKLNPSFWAGSEQNIDNLCSKSIKGSETVDSVNGQICSSHYTGIKVRIDNQYSQLANIVQLPTDPCYTPTTFDTSNNSEFPSGYILTGGNTSTLFGGDVYINRYTEKNTFFYFYDWLEGQPDGAQLNYLQHQMVPYPKYWVDFNEFQTSDFTTSFFNTIISFGTSGAPTLPSDFYALDGPAFNATLAGIISGAADLFRFDKRGWFYLFNSGVRDFFVESEINVANRDYGEIQAERFYDPYQGGDTKTLFDTAIIKSGNYYKYDISLSTTKLFTNYTSWGATQSPQYNPYIADTCFVYQPKKVIYSLPSQFEGLKDGWRIFLTNNYYNFLNVVTCIKPINKSGAIIFFDSASPVQFQGTDQLQTALGTKLTIGDGGLFSQPLQAIVNVESSHEYGSCQNRLSVINTPAGVFWISQNQGKIFTLGEGIKEISNINMKWWLASYLPYQIVKDYPNFNLLDNPVTGVSCQSVYDNENGLLYFCKKDYALKPNAPSIPVYLGGNKFLIGALTITLGDPEDTVWPLYFEDASWTISYDPKTANWLSYHDWHPTFNMPGKNTFMTISPDDRKSIWIHNKRCDLYCNYYEKDYPFELEFTVNTIQDVNSLRSIQYIMECYKYAANCYDRFHVLDFNFDEATIYNTEQTSGLLKLVPNPKENPTAILQYPVINPTNINILFSKEENKYRFNQFWDVTDDRGEFYNPTIPGFAERFIWNTQANGYVRLLNANNLNYNKSPLQRKKFRHYTVSILLRKLVSGNRKMLVMLGDIKNLISPR